MEINLKLLKSMVGLWHTRVRPSKTTALHVLSDGLRPAENIQPHTSAREPTPTTAPQMSINSSEVDYMVRLNLYRMAGAVELPELVSSDLSKGWGHVIGALTLLARSMTGVLTWFAIHALGVFLHFLRDQFRGSWYIPFPSN